MTRRTAEGYALVAGSFAILAYMMWTAGMGRIKVQHSSILGYLEPLSGPIYAYVLLGQAIGVWTVLGGALIAGAGRALRRTRRGDGVSGAGAVTPAGGWSGGRWVVRIRPVSGGGWCPHAHSAVIASGLSSRSARTAPPRRGSGPRAARWNRGCEPRMEADRGLRPPSWRAPTRRLSVARTARCCQARPHPIRSVRGQRRCRRPARSGRPGLTILLIYSRLWPDPG